VHAGSQNIESTLHVRVTEVGRDTRLGQLLRLIERGVRDKPPIVQFADRVGGWFIVAVSIAAAATFTYWARFSVSGAIDHAVALLIVTCPCVLGLATPLTIAIAIGKLARRDILVKSGAAIERLSRGGQILLDKTGTLTEGKLQLLRWIGDTSVQPAVAELERRSNHPVGRALHAALATEYHPRWRQCQITEVTEAGDGGVSGNVNGVIVRVGSPRFHDKHGTIIEDALAAAAKELAREGASVVLVSVNGRAVATAGLGDRIRDDSAAAVAAMRRLGWKAAILSGDQEHVVAAVAQRVGVEPDRCHAAMTPEQKLARVRSSARAGDDVVVMVGDGVNDAAALAAADVGVAVHGGAEASLAAADVYIAQPGLAPLVDLVRTSRRAMRTIRRNLLVSLSYNLLAGALAAAGMMSPLIAAIIMPVSSATVLWLAVASIGRSGPGRRGRSWK
jgi:Cu2+-exporting ATPase